MDFLYVHYNNVILNIDNPHTWSLCMHTSFLNTVSQFPYSYSGFMHVDLLHEWYRNSVYNVNIMILSNVHKWCQVSVIVIQNIPNESITSKKIPLMRSVFCILFAMV